LKHPNILGFRAVSASDPNYCLVTELAANGALNHYLNDSKVILNIEQKVKMALDIARGLQYLHSQYPPLIHGNLSSDNLLVSSDNRILISDFFLSIRPFTSTSNIQQKVKLYGTPYYLSPEVLENEVADERSDVYSLGVVMWEIYSRKPLFEGETNFELLTPSIIKGNRPISVDKLTKLIKDEKDDSIKSYLKLIKHGKSFPIDISLGTRS
jgi:sterile alpha motif and leucine zipper containing kinase AZK